MPAARGGRQARKQVFFFAKKNQKTFDFNQFSLLQAARQEAKVFASFFKKKHFLAACGPVTPPAVWSIYGRPRLHRG
jgi:hypothetical protein